MRRILIVVGCVVVLALGLPWLGFQVWLSQQSLETRMAINAFTSREFARVLWDEFFAGPIDDNGGFGRRDYPDRGHSPWVMRSSLDGRPRMLSLALAPEIWLAYSTETASIHQFWQGHLDFAGPAFDAHHGAEPMSFGEAYLRPPHETAWRVREAEGWRPGRVRWQAYGVDPETGHAWLRFAVMDSSGRSWVVTERPEQFEGARGRGLERRFEVALERETNVSHDAPSARPGTRSESDGALALVLGSNVVAGHSDFNVDLDLDLALDTDTDIDPAVDLDLARDSALDLAPAPDFDAGIERDTGTDNESGLVTDGADRMVRLRPGSTRLVQWFSAPTIAIEREPSSALETDAFARYDCATCHHPQERMTGPAWSEVAQRYGGANTAASELQLATRMIEGSVGRWGALPMSPHPDLARADALALARLVLATEPLENSEAPAALGREGVETSYEFVSGPPPDALHPSLDRTPIDLPGFTPQVGGLAWLPDGRLLVSTWDRDGAVFVVENWTGPPGAARVRRIAEGLHEPLGIAVVDWAIYVIQKQEVTQLVDLDGDEWIDEYRNLSNDWRVTSNFHEFGFGLVPLGGDLYGALSVCVLRGGKSCREQTPERGGVFRVSLETGRFEIFARGFRTPNGLAATPDGHLLVTDNQGDWLPASKLVRVSLGDDHGWRKPGELPDPADVARPALWLPQNEIGNSPTQPVVLQRGPYAGFVLFGDIFNGGLKRADLVEVAGQLQGAAFHFSGGLRAPVNRIVESSTGELVVGEIGSRGNWGEYGKPWFGLEVLRFARDAAFEPWTMRLRSDGFDLTFSRPIAKDAALEPEDFAMKHWFYVPSPMYGGPKYDVQALPIRSVRVSSDRRVVSLDVEGLETGRVVYLRIDPDLRSEDGESLWVNEAWYTLNAMPTRAPLREARRARRALPPVAAGTARSEAEPRGTAKDDALARRAPNLLSDAERAAGWQRLFDGQSFEGWKIYGASDDRIEGWVIEDGALKFTRDVSLLGLLWNHINPFATSALDLMTKQRFRDFELQIDWKVAPGANSGIFYLVPDEKASLAWTFGLEMQVLDDAAHPDGQIERHRAGDLYDLQSSATRAARPVGEWNTARIRVLDDHIEHWLNGHKVVDLKRGSAAWNEAIARSKFADTEGFGMAAEGHITLQDHGDIVWYRNIKVRRLEPVLR